MNPLTMTDQELIKHASKQVQALRMALDMIECEKYERRHVRWAIIDALKEELAAPVQTDWEAIAADQALIIALLKSETAAQPAPVQVSPLEFVAMVMEKEHLVGKPLFWAEWPNKENT